MKYQFTYHSSEIYDISLNYSHHAGKIIFYHGVFKQDG